MPALEYGTLTTQNRLFSHRILSLARWLTLLSTCTAPLLAQAQNCTGDNTDDQYILGEADGVASAMHWPTGLVWKRCIEGRVFGSSQCTASDTYRTWNGWAADYLPKPFVSQTNWGIDAAYSQNLLESGAWRMAYRDELRKITENCGDTPKVNRTVFPNTPSSGVWSGSPNASNSDLAWGVNFNVNGITNGYRSSTTDIVRLVRGGQSFAALTSPSAQTISAGDSVTFPVFTLASSVPTGEAWGGARISGDGNPEFQLNGTGDWVQEAIVKSGDQIAVRFNAPDSGSRTVTFTLHSGQTTGTSDNASNGGNEATAMQETSASFTANVPAAGVCGTADGVATVPAPSANLCSTGTASAVDGSATAFTWTCLGQYGGADSGQCSAPRQYEVTPSAGANGSIEPSSVQLVTAGQTASFTVAPAANYSSAISGTCPAGSWSGLSYTTGTIMASCTVTANFTGRTAMTLPLAEGPHSGETLDLTVTGSEWHIDAAQSLTAASLATTLPPGVTLPHGAVSLRLTDGMPGSNATVVLAYPENLPAGTRYYKYGPTTDNPTDHWYAYPGAVISGNTITLTLTDGGAGDSDLSVNGIIDDPGGPALISGGCGIADGIATVTSPSANLCSTGTASAVDGSTTAFTWICLGHGGADSGQCSAPRQYEVTPSAGANGTIAPSSVQLVTAGQTASFTVTPAANYSPAISGTCPAGSWSGGSYTTGTIMASCTVTANFTGRTAMTLPLAEGPHSGDTLDITSSGSEWHIDAAQSLTAASLATLPPRVTLPHGAVSLRLTNGTPGSNATVVLTYPEELPAGTRYYKYGPTADNPDDHWYAYPGAVISGNTITLTLTDGGAGDSDLSVNGIIDDPGGPAWITQDVAPIPTLPQWAMILLAGIMGMLAFNRMRVRNT